MIKVLRFYNKWHVLAWARPLQSDGSPRPVIGFGRSDRRWKALDLYFLESTTFIGVCGLCIDARHASLHL